MPWFSDCFLKHGLFSILLLSIDLSNLIVLIASLCVGSNILWGEPPCAVLALHCFICFMHPCSIIFPIAHSDTQQQGTWDWTSLICSSMRDGQSECMAMFIIVYMLITMNCQGQSWMDTSSIFWLDYKLEMECPTPRMISCGFKQSWKYLCTSFRLLALPLLVASLLPMHPTIPTWRSPCTVENMYHFLSGKIQAQTPLEKW